MAGRKKRGDFGRVIGVRLDAEIQAVVDAIVARSPLAVNGATDVVRAIVTHWVMESKNPASDFEKIARAVHEWRAVYVAGFSKGSEKPSGHAASPEGKRKRVEKTEK